MNKDEAIRHGLARTGDGLYSFAARNLTKGEALELLVVLRRLELYRVADMDVNVVEDAARTMSQFEMSRRQ